MGSAESTLQCASIMKDQIISAGGLAMNIATLGSTGSAKAAT